MPDTYIFEALEPDVGALVDQYTRRMQELQSGYNPDRDPVLPLVFQAVAQGEATLIEFASDVLATIFAEVAEQSGISRVLPAPAAGTVTLTTDGLETYVLPAGATVVGYLPDRKAVPLVTTADTSIPVEQTTVADVPVEAVTDGLLIGMATPQPLTPDQAYTWLLDVTLDQLTEPGADGEDDDAYMDRASRRKRGMGDMLILPANVQRFVADMPGVGRVLVLNLLDATDPAEPVVGVARCMTIVLTGPNGSMPSSGLIDEVRLAVAARREVNFRLFTVKPTYVPVTVELTVAAWRDRMEDVGDRVREAVKAWLHPGAFAVRGYGYGDGSWEPTSTVRVGEIVSVADNVEGVDYVDPTLVKIGGVNDNFALAAPIAALPDPDPLITTVTVHVVERTP